MKKILVFCLLALLVSSSCRAENAFWHPIDGPQATAILVPGNPPLTVGKQNAFLNCIEFGFSLALTQSEEEAIRSALMQEFLTYKRQLIESLTHLEDLWKAVSVANPDEKSKFRRLLGDSLLEQTNKNTGSGLGKVLGEIRQRGDLPVFSGNPKITKRSIAAFLELIQMALRLKDRRVVSWNGAEISNMESRLLMRIPGLAPEGRQWLSNADLHRSIIAMSWQRTPADEKEALKKLFVETFAPVSGNMGSMPVDIDAIPLPPPNLFPLPTELPWEMR